MNPPTSAWHVDDLALARWVEGTDGSVSGASVEQHLVACAECRAKVPAQPVVDLVWERVQDVVQVPRPTLLERVLRRTGLSQADARIVAVSPAFRAAWLAGLAGMLAFVTVAGAYGTGRGLWAFLVVAPMVPALAVALGYDPELDEALETECATPYSKLRLVLLRSAALLVVGLPAMVGVSLLVPGDIAFWWLAPAAGCTALVLVLSTWVPALTAVGAVGMAWLVLVSSKASGGAANDVLAQTWVAGYLAVAAVSMVGVLLRRGQILTWGAR